MLEQVTTKLHKTVAAAAFRGVALCNAAVTITPGMPALNTSPDPLVVHGAAALTVCSRQCTVVIHTLRKQRGVQRHFGTVTRFTGEVPVFIGTAVAQGVVVRPGLQFAAQRKGSGFSGGSVNRIHHFDAVAGCC